MYFASHCFAEYELYDTYSTLNLSAPKPKMLPTAMASKASVRSPTLRLRSLKLSLPARQLPLDC